MNLLDSLLDAIVRLDGDAMVMHVGEKPYVVTTTASMSPYRGPLAWGQVELSSKVFTLEALQGMLTQLLPLDHRQALEEYGATDFEVDGPRGSGERFTIVAAVGGDDVWIEIKRIRHPAAPVVAASPEPAAVSEEQQTTPEPTASDEHVAVAATMPEMVAESGEADVPLATLTDRLEDEPLVIVEAEEDQPSAGSLGSDDGGEEVEIDLNALTIVERPEGAIAFGEPGQNDVTDEVVEHAVDAAIAFAAAAEALREDLQSEVEEGIRAVQISASPAAGESAPEAPQGSWQDVRAVTPQGETDTLAAASLSEGPEEVLAETPRTAVVVPLARPVIRLEPPAEARSESAVPPVDRILRLAAARGASTVYVVAQSQPMIRVDGEISALDGEPALGASEVERLVMELAPAPARDAAQHGGEWMADVPGVGRVRCVTFRDHRGPGVIFRMIPPQAISADQLGLPSAVQALCAQPDGLVLVAGPRASGKSTLLTAFVDLINRTRSDHVITIEPQIGFVHESRRSFISQREVRGDGDAAAAATRSALREDPDVLVIEDLRTTDTVSLALEAAESGRLVFASLAAPTTVAAIDRFLELTPADRRGRVQASLAGTLRGVVAQVLLRKIRGGRVAAREVLLNTPAVAGLILDGKTFQLPVALESGRRHGMMPLAESLAAFVRDGTVQPAEAYRKAQDRDALIAFLKRDGIDTSFAERLA
jgi:twitching motility protein PilT